MHDCNDACETCDHKTHCHICGKQLCHGNTNGSCHIEGHYNGMTKDGKDCAICLDCKDK